MYNAETYCFHAGVCSCKCADEGAGGGNDSNAGSAASNNGGDKGRDSSRGTLLEEHHM